MAEKLEKEEFWKEMFILFDKEDRNFLTLDELKKFLQAVGVLVTNKELYKMLEEFDPDKIRQFTFDGYHAAKFYDTPELGMYKQPHFLANIDTYIQGRYKELFNTGIQRILKNMKGN